MHSFIAYFAATSTLFGCLALPVLIVTNALAPPNVTLKSLLTDHGIRDSVTSAVLAQVTFTSIATLAGAAAAAAWWLFHASHSHTNPIAFAIAGGGVGLIASINLTVPMLGPLVFKTKLPFMDIELLFLWKWALHGPKEDRAIRWLTLTAEYLCFLCLYVYLLSMVSIFFYAIGHKLNEFTVLKLQGLNALILFLSLLLSALGAAPAAFILGRRAAMRDRFEKNDWRLR